jgi:hypothetical protein
MTLAELQQGSLEHNSHLHAGLRSAPPIPVVSQYQSEPYSSYVGDQPPASQQYGHPYIPPYVPQAHPHNHHRERPSRDLDPERDDPNHLGRPVALSRLTSDVSGKSSPGMDAFSGDDAELLLSKSHGSGTFEERGAYGRERGMSNASGRLDERIVPGRERGGSNASGRASPYGGAFLQPRQAGPRGPMGSPGLPNDHVAGDPRLASSGLGQPQLYQYQQHNSRESESSAGHYTAPQSLAVPSDGHGLAPRRSGESARNAIWSEGDRSGRPSMDTSHEGKGGLRAMFSRPPHKDEHEAEVDEGKRKKGFFGLGGKGKDHHDDKDKSKFGRKIRKSDAEAELNRYPQDDGVPPINGSTQESGDWTHVGLNQGRASPMPGYPPSSLPATRVASPIPPPQQPTAMYHAPQFVAHEVSKKEREKAIRESQERTKEFLKAEKKDRERAEKEAAKAEKEEQKKRGEYGSVTWSISESISKCLHFLSEC